MNFIRTVLFFISVVVLLSCSENVTNNGREELQAVYSINLNGKSNQNQGIIWLNIKISNNVNINQSSLTINSDYDDYVQKLNYYLNQAMEDISMEVCGSILFPIGYHFENNHNLVGYDMIVVGFDISELKESCDDKRVEILFNDRNYNNQIQRLSININN